jgi:hypothetical protein
VKKVLAILLPFFPLSFILFIGLFLQIAEEEDALEENEDENFIKVAIVEDKAYWVINNILYEADVVDGEIEKEEASPVDAFKMNYKEVNKLMNILDNMQDWKN